MNSFAPQSSHKIGQLFQQANQAHVRGQFESARAGYLKVIKAQPKHFDALHLLGVLSCQLKEFEASIDYFNKAISISPNPVFYYSLGVAYQELARLSEAEQSYLSAIGKQPQYPEALYNLGNLKRAQGENLQAVAYYDRALVQKPDHADAHYNRGNALKELGVYDQAVISFDAAIAMNQSYAQAHLNKGMALKELGQFELALESYSAALRINPNYSDAYSNMGILQTELKRWSDAVQSFQSALSINPQHAQALWNKSLLLLQHGDFKGGFALYNTRWRAEVMVSPLLKSKNPWHPLTPHGGTTPGNTTRCKRLLIWSEQGIGDEVMFGALLTHPLISDLAEHLTIQLDSRLIPLFKRSFPQHQFIEKGLGLSDTQFDQHMPMGQLAEIFCQSLESFKSIRPSYLLSDAVRSHHISAQIKLQNKDDEKPIVGISWRSKNDKKGLDRSITATDLVGALSLNKQGGFDTDRFHFVNLQYNTNLEEVQQVSEALGINIQCLADIDNFSDIDGLASLISACDLVVSIDNSTVHLAGALGKPTYVLLPFSADWRWGLESSHSYWYPSLHLYRQSQRGGWAEPLLKLQADLIELIDP